MQEKSLVIFEDGISPDIVELVKTQLPAEWTLAAIPTGASVIVTANRDVTADVLKEAGASLQVIIKLVPGSAAISDTQVKVVEVGEPALFGVAEHVVALTLALSRQLFMLPGAPGRRSGNPIRRPPS